MYAYHGRRFTLAMVSRVVACCPALPGNFQPLIPQWEPASGEIESCLFALQAAAGGILVGSVFGYWVGLKKKA